MMKRIGLRNGFTLIELLIIVSIMGLLMTVGLAYYQNFNRRQIVVQAAGDLKNNLRLAQSKALSGEKPEGCTGTLLGWQVDFGAEEYTISAKCSTSPLSASKTYPLVKGVACAGPDWILFKPLAQGTETPGVGTPEEQSPEVTLSGEGCKCSSKVTISKSGEITIEENVPYVPPPTPTPTIPAPTPTPTLPPLTPTPTPIPTATPTPTSIPTPTPTPCAGYFQTCNPPSCCSPLKCKTFIFNERCQY